MPQENQFGLFYLYLINLLDPIIESGSPFNINFLLKRNFSEQNRMITLIQKAGINFPKKYFQNIQQINYVNIGFMLRTFLMFSKFLSKKSNAKRKYYTKKEFLNEKILDQKTLDQLKNNYFSNKKGNNDSLANQNNLKVPKELDEYEKSENGVPVVFLVLTNFFDLYPQHYELQGIFRTPGVITVEEVLTKKLSDGEFECIKDCNDPHVVAGLIKLFLRSLKSPLIPYEFYEKCCEANIQNPDKDQNTEVIVQILDKFPDTNKKVLMFLFSFINKFCAHAEVNLMTSYNFAILITPCIFKCPVDDPMKELQDTKKLIQITHFILDNDISIFNKIKFQEIEQDDE